MKEVAVQVAKKEEAAKTDEAKREKVNQVFCIQEDGEGEGRTTKFRMSNGHVANRRVHEQIGCTRALTRGASRGDGEVELRSRAAKSCRRVAHVDGARWRTGG